MKVLYYYGTERVEYLKNKEFKIVQYVYKMLYMQVIYKSTL